MGKSVHKPEENKFRRGTTHPKKRKKKEERIGNLHKHLRSKTQHTAQHSTNAHTHTHTTTTTTT
jgi:hypothetical protein